MKKILILITIVLLVYHYNKPTKEIGLFFKEKLVSGFSETKTTGFVKYTHKLSNHPLKEYSDINKMIKHLTKGDEKGVNNMPDRQTMTDALTEDYLSYLNSLETDEINTIATSGFFTLREVNDNEV